VNAELRITANKQMHLIGQNFQLDEFLAPAFKLLGKNCFDAFIYWLLLATSTPCAGTSGRPPRNTERRRRRCRRYALRLSFMQTR